MLSITLMGQWRKKEESNPERRWTLPCFPNKCQNRLVFIFHCWQRITESNCHPYFRMGLFSRQVSAQHIYPLYGGSGRIRTHVPFPTISFQDCPNRPLWHTSISLFISGVAGVNRTRYLPVLLFCRQTPYQSGTATLFC